MVKTYHEKENDEPCKCDLCTIANAVGKDYIHTLVALRGKISRRELVLMSTED